VLVRHFHACLLEHAIALLKGCLYIILSLSRDLEPWHCCHQKPASHFSTVNELLLGLCRRPELEYCHTGISISCQVLSEHMILQTKPNECASYSVSDLTCRLAESVHAFSNHILSQENVWNSPNPCAHDQRHRINRNL
jgi:hypothetical protein